MQALAEEYRTSSRDWTVSFPNIFLAKYAAGRGGGADSGLDEE